MKKKLFVCLVVVSIIAMSVLSAFASDVMPAYNNCSSCILNFAILDDLAWVSVQYTGLPNAFTHCMITVKIQKKTWGIFWKTVDINCPDDEWVYYGTQDVELVEQSFPITSAGTYRAVFYIEFYGSGGSEDVIDESLEYKYTK